MIFYLAIWVFTELISYVISVNSSTLELNKLMHIKKENLTSNWGWPFSNYEDLSGLTCGRDMAEQSYITLPFCDEWLPN